MCVRTAVWRKRLGVEPSLPAKRRATGFEDREGHRAPFASVTSRTASAVRLASADRSRRLRRDHWPPWSRRSGAQYGTCCSLSIAVLLTGCEPRRKVPVPQAPMMRGFVLSALLLTLPFGGMRVICVDASAPPEPGSDCERLCPLHHVSGTSGDSNCALSTDSSSLIVFASIVAVEPEQPASMPSIVSAVSADAPRCCLEPELAHHVPPPKLQILL